MNDICVYYDWDGSGEIFGDRIVKAKKSHKCCECTEEILPNQKYEKVVGKWDRNFQQYKTCLPCSGIRRDFFKCGWVYSEMWPMLIEALEDAGWEDRESGELQKQIDAMVPKHFKQEESPND